MSGVNKPIDARVTRLIRASAPVGDAVRIALGGSIPVWAKRHGIHRTIASMAIYGRRFPTPSDVLAALVADLGGSEDEWRRLLFEAARPVEEQPSARQAAPPEEATPAAQSAA